MASIESKSSDPYADQIGKRASVSEVTPVSMKRTNGIVKGSSAAATAATVASTRGRGAPRSTHTSSAIRKNGATTKVFRSWIRFANSEAKAATTSRTEVVTAIAAARKGARLGSSRRASSTSRKNAAKGRTPR